MPYAFISWYSLTFPHSWTHRSWGFRASSWKSPWTSPFYKHITHEDEPNGQRRWNFQIQSLKQTWRLCAFWMSLRDTSGIPVTPGSFPALHSRSFCAEVERCQAVHWLHDALGCWWNLSVEASKTGWCQIICRVVGTYLGPFLLILAPPTPPPCEYPPS